MRSRSRPCGSKRPRMPAMPHMRPPRSICRLASAALTNRCEYAFVALGAAIDEECLDALEIVSADVAPHIRLVVQLHEGACEVCKVIQLDDVTGFSRLQKVGLSAAVVAHDGESKGHGLEKHQTEPFVLAG